MKLDLELVSLLAGVAGQEQLAALVQDLVFPECLVDQMKSANHVWNISASIVCFSGQAIVLTHWLWVILPT